MPAFLKKLSEQIYHLHKERLGDICLVLPNRRAALFIRRYLSEILDNTSFLPTFYSIEDFVTESSDIILSDAVSLQFHLYDIHRSIEKQELRTIEEFLPYASWMLSDFNDIDMYLVDAEGLFNYLGDAKAISLWNLDGKALSEMEERYLYFFRSLKTYYKQLNERLSINGVGYQGMAFRKMATNIESIGENLKWEKIIFAGFNALTRAEENIIQHLVKNNKAEIYWDADKYYTRNNSQEAGEFLRKYFTSSTFGEIRWEEDNFAEDKEIEVIGIPKNTGQVKYAGELLKNICLDNNNLSDTALVLPDEALLLPLLSSIPEEAGPFNVTMGLPLNSTPLFSLIDNILGAHQNAERYQKIRPGNKREYYVHDLLKVFNHPWMHSLVGESANDSLSSRIRKSNMLFLDTDKIISFLDTEQQKAVGIASLFPANSSPLNLLISIIELIGKLRSVFIEKRTTEKHDQHIELEYLFRFSNLSKRLTDLMKAFDHIRNTKTLRLVFRQLASMQRIPFYGEPLQGLQIMGMLETRTLDFNTLIILSMNEGILPSSHSANSFIPFDIKKNFGLPTYKDNNAVFAYHFYRLIQRSHKVYLLYNTEAGQLGGEEKSRFITQLLNEVRKYNSGIVIREKLLSMPVIADNTNREISIPKDKAVMDLLYLEAERGFHPSSLSRYIKCPLQFYFSRLIKIKELDDVEETIDNRVLGIVIHESLNSLLGRHLGKQFDKDMLLGINKEVPDEVRRQFGYAMAEGELDFGKNHLILNVAINMLQQYMKKEISWLNDGLPLMIEKLEDTFRWRLSIEKDGKPLEMNFTGTIDRIDRKGDCIRILDYKTGFVKASQLSPGSWEKLIGSPDSEKAFQLMLYSWLYKNKYPTESQIVGGIISLRMPGNGPVELKPPEKRKLDTALLQDFELELKKLMLEIFDEDIPFIQTEDDKQCTYCDFKEICNKTITNDNY